MVTYSYPTILAPSLRLVTNGYMEKKLTPMSIRFDPEVKAALEREAADEDRSLSWLVNRALRERYGLQSAPAQKRGKPVRR